MADLTDGQKVTAGYWEGISPSDNEIETNKAVTIDASTYSSAVEVKPTGDYDAMKKVTVTLSNNTIEANKTVSINASEYTEPVEITPSSSNNVMKKVTVTLTNLSKTLFAWKNSTAIIYTKTAEPTTSDKALVGASTGLSESAITAVGEDFASITVSATEYTRYDTGDVVID